MRFIHITDTHIGPTPDHVLGGFNTFKTAERLVETINALPFEPDFVLHTGDIVDDRSEAAYSLAKSILQKLKAPVFYVLGNHDRAETMQRVMLNKVNSSERYDYYAKFGKTALAVFDTRGPVDPAGTLLPEQLAALQDLCSTSGPSLLIALHHQPVKLDVSWLDSGWDQYTMMLDCHEQFHQALLPARERIRGVFFGHVHRSAQVQRNGILFSSAPSACVQFAAFPNQARPQALASEPPGFSVVTVNGDQTTVRHHTFERP
jgi:Icc protein